MCGASGGFYALVGADISNVALNWNAMRHPYLYAISVAVPVGRNIFTALQQIAEGLPTNAPHAAHAGGFIGGILLGFIFLRILVEENGESRLRKVAVVAYTAFTLSCILVILVRPLIYQRLRLANGTEANGTCSVDSA
ncbi:Rhomboid-related protein 2 [Aphelenchoides avenae]|nr:Rhomboid-related protein 2 [Aphelenchus avenae]